MLRSNGFEQLQRWVAAISHRWRAGSSGYAFIKWTLFFGYFIAGVRHFTALTAGMSKVKVRTFMLYAYPGGLVWVVSLYRDQRLYFLGSEWESLVKKVRHKGLCCGRRGCHYALIMTGFIYGVKFRLVNQLLPVKTAQSVRGIAGQIVRVFLFTSS